MATANAITITAQLSVLNGNLTLMRQANGLQFNQSGGQYSGGAVSVPTSATALTLTNSTVGGWGFFRNTDTTNFITLGLTVSATYYPMVQIPAGGVALFPIGTTAIYAKADTAAVTLDFDVLAA
jgi:hypothetical protein